MKISFSTVPANLELNSGYGIAGFNMVRSLQNLGHKVPFQDPTAKVQIHFSQPEWKKFFLGQHKIIYTPWESTELKPGWKTRFNNCDEVWTTSPLIKEWYEAAGVIKPITVYEHGADPRWWADTPTEREPGPVRFLHVGAPAGRKRADLAVKAFRAAFGDSTDVELIIKSYGGHWLGKLNFNNVRHDWRIMTEPQLNRLYHYADVIVYPSMGEGFGLIPLQGLCIGKPVICTEAWAPYKEFLQKPFAIESKMVDSPWPYDHPGQMFEPDFDNLVAAYREAWGGFNCWQGVALGQMESVRAHYEWNKLTADAFEHVVTQFGNADTIVPKKAPFPVNS